MHLHATELSLFANYWLGTCQICFREEAILSFYHQISRKSYRCRSQSSSSLTLLQSYRRLCQKRVVKFPGLSVSAAVRENFGGLCWTCHRSDWKFFLSLFGHMRWWWLIFQRWNCERSFWCVRTSLLVLRKRPDRIWKRFKCSLSLEWLPGLIMSLLGSFPEPLPFYLSAST